MRLVLCLRPSWCNLFTLFSHLGGHNAVRVVLYSASKANWEYKLYGSVHHGKNKDE